MLNRIIEEIKKSLANECYIAALALALTIPDICGKAEYPNAKSETTRYIYWYNAYVGQYEKPSDEYGGDMPYMSGSLIYNLRNSLLHQGTPSISVKGIKDARNRVDSFTLTISDDNDTGLSVVSYGNNWEIVDRKIEVNLCYLCKRLCAAGKKYYDENTEKFDFFKYQIKDKRKLNEENYW